LDTYKYLERVVSGRRPSSLEVAVSLPSVFAIRHGADLYATGRDSINEVSDSVNVMRRNCRLFQHNRSSADIATVVHHVRLALDSVAKVPKI